MTWLQPIFFWGLLGIAVPILIHLLSGRKGKVMAWAATAWLNPQDSQSSRSLRIDHWLLLLVRVLLWTLLILFFVGFWWKVLTDAPEKSATHLIIPSESLEAEFRFELDQALKQGESVYWLAEGLPEYESGTPNSAPFNSENIQSYLDQIENPTDSLQIYAKGSSAEFPHSTYWLPSHPAIHLSEEEFEVKPYTQIQLESGKYLGLGEEGVLEVTDQKSAGNPVLSSPIGISFDRLDAEKESQLVAALAAITEVYGLNFTQTDSANSSLIFTSDSLLQPAQNQLVLDIESLGENSLSNPVSLPWEEVNEKGILPERILAKILSHYGIDKLERPITSKQLSQKFELTPKAKEARIANTHEILLILIVLVFGLERYLAYKNNQ